MNIIYVLTTKQAKYKRIVIEQRSPCYFETVVFKDFFSFVNFTFVTRN